MVRASLLALALVSLSTVVGCGASATRHTGAPHSPEGSSAIARDEASWCSPEEVELKMLEKAATHAPVAVAPEKAAQSIRPNGNARPTKGAVHAATY